MYIITDAIISWEFYSIDTFQLKVVMTKKKDVRQRKYISFELEKNGYCQFFFLNSIIEINSDNKIFEQQKRGHFLEFTLIQLIRTHSSQFSYSLSCDSALLFTLVVVYFARIMRFKWIKQLVCWLLSFLISRDNIHDVWITVYISVVFENNRVL